MSVENYGDHPTRYSDLSNDQLYGYYRSSAWNSLSSDERLEVMQETVNRSAAAHQEVGSCKVEWFTPGENESNTCAVQTGSTIRVNSDMYANHQDMPMSSENVEEIENASMMALESVLHEDEHAYQNQCIHDVIEGEDAELVRQYKANDFEVADVTRANGTHALGQEYISYGNGNDSTAYYLYYLQSTERDAYRFSQAKTREIAQRQAAMITEALERGEINGVQMTEKERLQAEQDLAAIQEYERSLEYRGYEANEKKAMYLFNDEMVEADINTVLTNAHYKEKQPLHEPGMEPIVHEGMALSFEQRMSRAEEEKTDEEAENNNAGIVENETEENSIVEEITASPGAAEDDSEIEDDSEDNSEDDDDGYGMF